MPQTATLRQHTEDHPAQPLRDGIAEVELALMPPIGSHGVAMVDAWADILALNAGFAAERMRHDARTLHAVLHCRTADELQAIQGAFVQKAVDDYLAQAGRMTELVNRALPGPTGRGPKG